MMKLNLYYQTYGDSVPYLLCMLCEPGSSNWGGASITATLTPELIASLRNDLDKLEVQLAKDAKKREIEARIKAELDAEEGLCHSCSESFPLDDLHSHEDGNTYCDECNYMTDEDRRDGEADDLYHSMKEDGEL